MEVHHFNMKKLLLSLILCMLLVTSVYAGDLISNEEQEIVEIPVIAIEDKAGWDIDNVYDFTKTEEMKYGKVEIKNSFLWILPQDTIEVIELKDNTDTCGQYCSATKEITTYTDTKLVDGVKFLKLEDGKWIESSIRSYQFYIKSKSVPYEVEDTEWVCTEGKTLVNGTIEQNCENKVVGTHTAYTEEWLPYNYEVMPAGTYTLKLEGEKRPDWTYDWIITSQGKELSEWSVWGGTTYTYDNTGKTLSTTGGDTNKYGVEIVALTDITITTVTSSSNSVATRTYIIYSNGTQLANASIVNKNATFNVVIPAGLSVDVVNDAEGASFLNVFTGGGGYPVTGTKVKFNRSASVCTPTCSHAVDYWNEIQMITTSTGSGSNVTLNSPANNYISPTNLVTFNATATVTGGATLTNMSLWDNSTGTWKLNQTNILTGTANTSTFTNSYPNAQSILWGIQACDSDGACGFSENRTVLIDTTAPSISITYPTGVLNGLVNGQSLQLNYSVSDTNLQTCWREYNGVNTTIVSCANTTFTYVNGVNSIRVYANDSVGNLNYDDQTWIQGLTINSLEYNVNTYETSDETFRLNITSEISSLSISGTLWYNGTAYTSTVIPSGTNNYTLFNSLAMPLSTSATNRSFFFQITQYNGTGQSTINTSVYWQNAGLINLQRCNTTFSNTFINFTAYDEETLVRVRDFSFKGTINYWLGNGNSYKNLSINENYINETSLCASPADKTFIINANIEYGDNNDTYLTKNYLLNNYNITNQTTNISLYMLDATKSTTFILKVQDTSQNPVADTYIHIQRYFPGTNSYETVQISKTNDDGKTVGFYQTETVTYRHLLYNENGTLLLQTSDGKVFAESVPYTIIFTIGSAPQIPWKDLEVLTQLSSSIGYNNNTKIANFTYVDTSTIFESARFLVEKSWLNQSNQVICNVTSISSAEILTCNLASYNGTMIGYGFITRDGIETLVELDSWVVGSTAKQTFDKSGLFLAWFIMLVAAGVFIYNFVAGMWVECGAILLVNFIGLATFPAVYIWGAIALTIITTVIMGKDNYGGGY